VVVEEEEAARDLEAVLEAAQAGLEKNPGLKKNSAQWVFLGFFWFFFGFFGFFWIFF
jgi:hypothetical protein